MPTPPALRCYIPGMNGIEIGRKLASSLKNSPWQPPHGAPARACRLFVPESLAHELPLPDNGLFCLCPRLAQEARHDFHKAAGHIFISACGIAVRAIAPCLKHKSVDPPVIVIDPAGRHAICLLSGHWCGGNRLTLHLAALLGASPIITTQSETCGKFALDLFLQEHDMRILDWGRLPAVQAGIAAGCALPLDDPFHLLPPEPFLAPENREMSYTREMPLVSIDFRKSTAKAGKMRVAPRLFHLGVGFRRHADAAQLEKGLQEFLDFLRLESGAIHSIATVSGKGDGLMPLANQLQASLHEFSPPELAAAGAPNPSSACGRRFGQKPFSVCEGAALLSAGKSGKGSSLVAEKYKWRGLATFALAISGTEDLATRIRESLK